MSRYDNMFSDMTGIQVADRMRGGGYSAAMNNFGYSTDANKRVDINRNVDDTYQKPASMKPFSGTESGAGFGGSGNPGNERGYGTAYYNPEKTNEAYDELRNPDAQKNAGYYTGVNTDMLERMAELAKYPIKETDAYKGYEYTKRAANIATLLVSVPAASAGLKHMNKHYDNSALNDALVKNGFNGIVRSSNISNGRFVKDVEKALKDGQQWNSVTNKGNFTGEFDHIEFGSINDKNMQNGQIIVVTKDGKKHNINTKDLIINTKDGDLNGRSYMQKFLTDRKNKEQEIFHNVRDVNSYLRNDSTFGSLGIHNMNSKEILSRLKIKNDGTATFRGTFGRSITLTPEQVRILQDVAHQKELGEAAQRKKNTKGKRRKAFAREVTNMIKDDDLYQGASKINKFRKITVRVIKAPSMLVNSRINHRRIAMEKKAAKGRLSAHGQKKYDKLYGKDGIFTVTQKGIGNTINEKLAPIKNETNKKIKQGAKKAASATVGRAGRAVGRGVKKGVKKSVTYLRGKSTKFDKFMAFSGKTKNKIGGKINSFKENHKLRKKKKKNKKHFDPFDSIRRVIRIAIGVLVGIILIPTILASILPVMVPMIAGGAAAAAQEALKMEEAQSKATASTKEIYTYMHQEYPAMSLADILGIMSLMKYQSDLNAFYMKSEDEMGLLCFSLDEQSTIIDIANDNGWADPFTAEYAGDSDDYSGDEEGAYQVDLYKLRESREAQIKYICTLVNDNNYPSVTEVSPDTMASQAMVFAENVRGMELNDVQKADIQQAAIDMYYEYVMWDIEYLKVNDNSAGATLVNAALFPYARVFAGEHVNMKTLYGNSSLSSYTKNWSNWFVKYVFAQTNLTEELGCYYLTSNLNDIERLMTRTDENKFWHSYEEVANTEDTNGETGGIKPGYLVVTQETDKDDNTIYKIGIVVNVQPGWDSATSSSSTSFTVLMADDYGTNIVYDPDKKLTTSISAKYTGSADETTLRMTTFSMTDYRCSQTTSFDEYINIVGFIAWYDPVDSMVNHDCENRRLAAEEEAKRAEEEAKKAEEEANNSNNSSEEDSDDSEDSDDNSDSEDDSGSEDVQWWCDYCHIDRDDPDADMPCDAPGGSHDWVTKP